MAQQREWAELHLTTRLWVERHSPVPFFSENRTFLMPPSVNGEMMQDFMTNAGKLPAESLLGVHQKRLLLCFLALLLIEDFFLLFSKNHWIVLSGVLLKLLMYLCCWRTSNMYFCIFLISCVMCNWWFCLCFSIFRGKKGGSYLKTFYIAEILALAIVRCLNIQLCELCCKVQLKQAG